MTARWEQVFKGLTKIQNRQRASEAALSRALDRFEQAFRDSEEKIYKSAADDFGKPQAEMDMSEIMAVLAELKHVRKT